MDGVNCDLVSLTVYNSWNNLKILLLTGFYMFSNRSRTVGWIKKLYAQEHGSKQNTSFRHPFYVYLMYEILVLSIK